LLEKLLGAAQTSRSGADDGDFLPGRFPVGWQHRQSCVRSRLQRFPMARIIPAHGFYSMHRNPGKVGLAGRHGSRFPAGKMFDGRAGRLLHIVLVRSATSRKEYHCGQGMPACRGRGRGSECNARLPAWHGRNRAEWQHLRNRRRVPWAGRRAGS